jgi:hypothetical protein
VISPATVNTGSSKQLEQTHKWQICVQYKHRQLNTRAVIISNLGRTNNFRAWLPEVTQSQRYI